jgi:hypothetical protein
MTEPHPYCLEHDQPLDWCAHHRLHDQPWVAGDGTHWLWFPVFGEWYGWMPGEAGLWCYPDEEFRRIYDAPAV